MKDLPTILLTVALIATVTAIAIIVVLDGKEQLAGTGLGALTVVLSGALAWRVKRINGKEPHE